MNNADVLFEPAHLGSLEIPNRICMAPLTRNRAHNDSDAPDELAGLYYSQRASAGLIISEATQISPIGKGYAGTPGIYNTQQVAAWRKIIRQVKAAGGRIFCQLWHVGRISHTSLLPAGCVPLSSSALQADAQTFIGDGMVATSKPDAMSLDQIKNTLDDYRTAAQWALEAGFDGVEVHSGNGYLLDQFLQDSVNQRDDEYGGAIENRQRFLLQAVEAACSVWPSNRVGVRLSPLGQFNDMGDSDPQALFSTVYRSLSNCNLAYLHIVESFPGNDRKDKEQELLRNLRKEFKGAYIANGNYDANLAAEMISCGHADAITFGRPFLANPDLPMRILLGCELNEPNPDTFYGGGAEGYTDYPFLDRNK